MAKRKKVVRKNRKKKEMKCCKDWNCGDCGGFGYFLGFIGAAIYFISNATGFWMGVLGFLKALVWPVFLVLEAMKFIGV